MSLKLKLAKVKKLANQKTFDFDEQMKVGDRGEMLFTKAYSNLAPVKSADDLKYDFNTSIGTVELKTDTYSMAATPNFFMERYGCMNSKKDGGPWRASLDKIDYFVYFYINDGTFFWFKTEELMKIIDPLATKKRERWIKNKAWTAIGYTIPRAELSSAVIHTDIFSTETPKEWSHKWTDI